MMLFKRIFSTILLLMLVSGILTGCGKNDGNSNPEKVKNSNPEKIKKVSKKPVKKPVKKTAKKPEKKSVLELDMSRIAADEARGIIFSMDYRTLIKYNNALPDTAYTIPNGVTAIADKAFYKCSSLAQVTIPESVASIGEAAFSNCTLLANVTIPGSVASIGEAAFMTCKKIEVSPDNRNFYSDKSGALIDRKNQTLLHLPRTFSGSYTIPDGITSIGGWAFYHCDKLTSVTIPDSVNSIGRSSFANCTNLMSVTIPDSVTSIKGSAFSNCKKLTLLTIPNSVNSIGMLAFGNCTNLTNVKILNNKISIEAGAFFKCPCEAAVKKQFPKYEMF